MDEFYQLLFVLLAMCIMCLGSVLFGVWITCKLIRPGFTIFGDDDSKVVESVDFEQVDEPDMSLDELLDS